MPDDIREVPDEKYWNTFESMWTNLLSYRYLGRRHGSLDKGVEGPETMVLRHDMRNAAGGIMAAPLCIAAPESGGMGDDLFVPNPVSASMQVLDDARVELAPIAADEAEQMLMSLRIGALQRRVRRHEKIGIEHPGCMGDAN